MKITLKNKNILPLIQGGMGVGVSLSNLAGNLALNNCIGTIAAVNIGYREKDFLENPLKANLRALKNEIKKAKEISKNKGLIAVNIMCAINNYSDFVKCAVKEKADIIVSGAGLPLNLPAYANEDILLAPIVSSKRALNIIVNFWIKNYKRLPDLVIVEGPLAGGHLGFKKNQLYNKNLETIVKEVRTYINTIEEKFNKKILIFAAGGIRNKFHKDQVLKSGADGIQVATSFIASEECDANIKFKEAIICNNDQNIKIINSPVGMIARAIENDFTKKLNGNLKPKKCINCLKTCNPATTKYCISQALNSSVLGKEGLIFSGSRINEITKIEPVKNIIERLMEK